MLGVEAFSGRIWQDGKASDIDCVRVIGDHVVVLPQPLAAASADTYSRQVLAWGNLGQNQLAAAHVAIVGSGGTVRTSRSSWRIWA